MGRVFDAGSTCGTKVPSRSQLPTIFTKYSIATPQISGILHRKPTNMGCLVTLYSGVVKWRIPRTITEAKLPFRNPGRNMCSRLSRASRVRPGGLLDNLGANAGTYAGLTGQLQVLGICPEDEGLGSTPKQSNKVGNTAWAKPRPVDSTHPRCPRLASGCGLCWSRKIRIWKTRRPVIVS